MDSTPAAGLPGYSLVISGGLYSSQAPATALAFAKALVSTGHRIDRVFLYGEGVSLASALNTPPSDETDWTRAWQELLTDQDIPAFACIASALRRGLLNQQEADRYQRPAANLADGFVIAGLGEWVQALADSDRVIHFPGGA
ncbi:tRNA 2-thiouridine synthesizing protein D [Marinobacter daqiaonensis]|uniref:tRNA 2-thiouridine synthesizing protein D n=1 Tax=Marinobacter daqiaonensis TaxID=650891 RepID=A0A1I6GUT0_9GAMM|nr:sulfurtransferase complex subunit TusD [Marinobacter daqiaonensis]SFR45918.1 tRNA 2-thiouridine synthesizing protein D [Marinobacter daqiaonensis]